MKNLLLLLLSSIFLLTNLASAGDYIIGDGDSLSVSVWKEPELSGEVTVRPDGKITLPAIGDVVATGMTPQILARSIEKALKSVVKQPIVTLTAGLPFLSSFAVSVALRKLI